MADTNDGVAVFCHSQGCQVAGEWLAKYANADPERLRFVLTGNLERAFYGYAARKPSWVWSGNIRRLTPNTTRYRVLDIGRKGDRFANGLHGIAALLAFLPHSGHLDYSSVNPDKVTLDQVVKVVGETIYVTV